MPTLQSSDGPVAARLGAWPGIFRNAGTIARALGKRAVETGERTVRRLGEGLRAWRGVAENARTIGRVVTQRAGEWVDRQVEAATERARSLWQGLFGRSN